MVVEAPSRLRVGAAALAAALAAGLASGLTTGLTTASAPASAMVLRSDHAARGAWADRYDERVVSLVNERRARHGLRRVRTTPCASSWARSWSRQLDRSNRFEHSNLARLLDRCNASYAAENIALVHEGARPAELVRMWMRSPGHRANILSPRVRLTGVSVRWDASRSAWVAVQDFVRR